MATLNVFNTAVAYDDPTSTNAPSLKHFDRASKVQNISVERPTSAQYVLSHREVKTAFSGVRDLNVDETTSFHVWSQGKGVYSLYHASGAHPMFREDRFVDLSGTSVEVTENNNQTITLTVTGTEPSYFDDVVFGDILSISDPFSAPNQGEWVVIGSSATTLTVKPSDCAYEAETETVEIDPGINPVSIYSPDGVQVGDKVELVSGFSPGSLRTYEVIDVIPEAVFFTSTEPLTTEIVSDTVIRIYSNAKKYMRLETNGEIEVRINDAPEPLRLSTISLSTGDRLGWLDTCGPIYAAEIRSLESSPVTVNILSCE